MMFLMQLVFLQKLVSEILMLLIPKKESVAVVVIQRLRIMILMHLRLMLQFLQYQLNFQKDHHQW
jgi:hypothetical protein